MSKYNHCSKCQKWLGIPRWLAFWETNKVCEDCAKPKPKIIFF